MKRTFLVRRNALLSSTNLSWGTLALAGATFLLLLRLLAPNFFWQIFTPLFRVSDTLARESHAFFDGFGNTATLALQNEKLMNENAALANENQALLKKTTSISELVPDTRGIIAGIVARPPASPYDTLVLSAGSAEGVTLGMEAFGAGGVPLGVVSSVLANFSRVTLFSAPNMTVNGWVGRTNVPIIISGAGAGALNASVTRSAGIAAGDIVFAPGPGMLPIGVVTRIDGDPASPSVILRIMPILNVFSIAWVVVRDTGAALRGAFSSTTPILP